MPRGVKGFIKGRKKTGGRKAGTPNKFTTLRDAFIDAFKELGAARGLIKWVKADVDNQRAFYSLIARMLPAEMRVRETAPPGIKLSMSALRASTIALRFNFGDPIAETAGPGPSKDPEQMSDEELEAAIREEERRKNVHTKRPQTRKGKKAAAAKSPGRKRKARKG